MSDLSGPVSLSVAAPAYNEADGIAAVVADWQSFLATQNLADFEIVICNDGSKDQTGALLDHLALAYPRLKPLHFATNQGAAAALNAAITATKGDWVLLLDSDGQFPIQNLPAMMAALRQAGPPHGLAAIGIRQKKDIAFARFGSWASGVLCNLAHGSRLKDFNSAFKLVSGPVLRGLGLEAKGMNYSTEITSRLLECGIVPVEVTIEHRPRLTGTSHMKLMRGARDRFLFVLYVILRQALLKRGILTSPLGRPRP
ncbi:MAG TPA: glycosyltransferase family 2 protein [Rhizomicrobium sp.]|nr:glycosyltransferase family 2 protein [Rhizomicrobium sp.]